MPSFLLLTDSLFSPSHSQELVKGEAGASLTAVAPPP